MSEIARQGGWADREGGLGRLELGAGAGAGIEADAGRGSACGGVGGSGAAGLVRGGFESGLSV